MHLENIFLPLLQILDISSFNPRVAASVLLLTIIGETNVQIPLLMESMWLLIGYQTHLSAPNTILNAVLLFLIAQVGRQTGITGVYFFFPVIQGPLTKLFLGPLQANRLYRRFIKDQDTFDTRFLSPVPATLGMLTPLNAPIKLLLIWRRKLRTLLTATLLSGMAFDGFYLLVGAIFRTTTLNITFFPLFLLLSFLVFIFIRVKILK